MTNVCAKCGARAYAKCQICGKHFCKEHLRQRFTYTTHQDVLAEIEIGGQYGTISTPPERRAHALYKCIECIEKDRGSPVAGATIGAIVGVGLGVCGTAMAAGEPYLVGVVVICVFLTGLYAIFGYFLVIALNYQTPWTPIK